MILEWSIGKIRIKIGRDKKIMEEKWAFMFIKSFDNARLIFKIFGQNKTLDNENTYKMYWIFAKFSNTIYTHLETFFIKDY